eukprot:243271-Rhodomonas_salina.1
MQPFQTAEGCKSRYKQLLFLYNLYPECGSELISRRQYVAYRMTAEMVAQFHYKIVYVRRMQEAEMHCKLQCKKPHSCTAATALPTCVIGYMSP